MASTTNPLLIQEKTTRELETRLAEIDAELIRLAQFTPRSGAGNIGWISKPAQGPDQPEWAEVQLPPNTKIDQIVLVPILWNDADKGPQADGFPSAFEIVVGSEDEPDGRVIASFDPEDEILPRVAPIAIDTPAIPATWLRIQSKQLSACARDGRYAFSLAEIMVFDGAHNVALKQPTRVSSVIARGLIPSIYKDSLTDGFTPFLMDAEGPQSNPHLSNFADGDTYSFIIDLGADYPIDEVHYHSLDVSEHFPQIYQVDYGFPLHLIVEAALQPDFSDAVTLLDYQRSSVYETGPILVRNTPRTLSRYIRLSVPEPYQAAVLPKQHRNVVGLSELELIADGTNVALGKKVIFPNQRRGNIYPLKPSITDGDNHFGIILPIREWMQQLVRRHELERERPLVADELSQRYIRQQIKLRRMIWLAALLAIGIAFTVLIERFLRQRAFLKARERIAANLHDELSANIHAIGLLSDMAKDKADEQSGLVPVLDRIRQLTERSGRAARHCAKRLEARYLCDDLIDEMQHAADQILVGAQHNSHIEGEAFLDQFSAKKRSDLFLFYKECLTNIIRHSGATEVNTVLSITELGQLHLSVADNGKGISKTPPSLKRRARLLRAKVQTERTRAGGTQIKLSLRYRRGPLFR